MTYNLVIYNLVVWVTVVSMESSSWDDTKNMGTDVYLFTLLNLLQIIQNKMNIISTITYIYLSNFDKILKLLLRTHVLPWQPTRLLLFYGLNVCLRTNNDIYHSQCSFTTYGGCPFSPLAHFAPLSMIKINPIRSLGLTMI